MIINTARFVRGGTGSFRAALVRKRKKPPQKLVAAMAGRSGSGGGHSCRDGCAFPTRWCLGCMGTSPKCTMSNSLLLLQLQLGNSDSCPRGIHGNGGRSILHKHHD
ncbi:unnamed protein product [Lampetra fluviatilis]